ncbi:MAG: SDR family oxidoreductase, partial [Actinobacteria bacterium]|nr:SDR family oxidoreductase [Actinomycetota bacterium]
IGRAVAVALAGEGFRVAVVGRRRDALAETAALTGSAETLVCPGDVGSPTDVGAAFEALTARWGRLDLLFNNAGVAPAPAPIEEVELETWRATIDANLTGAFLCTQQAFRLMKAQDPRGGRIVNNGSVSAHVPRPHAAAYTASKHGLTGLTKQTSLEGRAYDIACGQIDIGNAATDLAQAFVGPSLQPDGSRRQEPFMAVDDVVRAVLYMASLPLDANVQFMTVMATAMPYVGRG